MKDQGELAAALPLFERALAIHEKVLGPEHPSTKNSIHFTANALNALGRAQEAEALRAKYEIKSKGK